MIDGLLRCLCRSCLKTYFVHPQQNAYVDSGFCPHCDDEIKALENWYAGPKEEEVVMLEELAPRKSFSAMGVLGAVVILIVSVGICGLAVLCMAGGSALLEKLR